MGGGESITASIHSKKKLIIIKIIPSIERRKFPIVYNQLSAPPVGEW